MKYKILVVDDDKELVKMLCSYFNMKQYETITATDGMEALNKIKMKPDIILLDINMPHMDGIEVCRLIRSKVLCPILFLTARVDEDDKINGLLSGGDDYITNDASKEMPMGELSSSENLEDFDTQTITGAMEYIIVYAKQAWNCPVIFYTGTKYDSKQYQQMVDVLFELQDKYGIGVIDLWNDEEMNDVSEKEYEVYMADPVHPTQAGYLEWWTPKMEEYLYQFLER